MTQSGSDKPIHCSKLSNVMDPQPPGSTGRPDTSVEQHPDLLLAIEPARIRGAWVAGEPAEIALVLDGIVQAIVPMAPDGFDWSIPPHVFGRLLDIVSTATGASLLRRPADLSAVRTVRWTRWALGPQGVVGAFDAVGTDAGALPIAFVADGHHHASGFARRRCGDEFVFELPLSRLPTGTGGHMLSLNAKVRKKLGKDVGDEVTVRITERLT